MHEPGGPRAMVRNTEASNQPTRIGRQHESGAHNGHNEQQQRAGTRRKQEGEQDSARRTDEGKARKRQAQRRMRETEEAKRIRTRLKAMLPNKKQSEHQAGRSDKTTA